MKKSKRYCCPSCLAVFPKDPGTIMLSSNPDEGLRGVYHLDVLERKENYDCPRCRQPMNFKRLVNGDFDYHGWGAEAGIVVGAIAIAALRFILGWGWPASSAAGLVLSIALALALGRRERLMIRAKTSPPPP